jgi:multidrug resistance efflux pump
MPPATGNDDSTPQTFHVTLPGSSAPPVVGLQPSDIQQRLLTAIGTSNRREDALPAILCVLMELVRPAGMLYCQRDGDNKLTPRPHLSPAGTGNIQRQLFERLVGFCNAACQQGELQVNDLDERNRLVASTVPILLRGKPTEAIGLIFPKASVEIDRITGILQVVAAHITLADVLEESKAAESESKNTAALLDLLGKCESSSDLKRACITLVNDLQEFLQCDRVAVGMCGLRRKSCRLIAVSGLSQFDKRAKFATSIEVALDEAILRDKVTRWPPGDESDRSAALAHQRVCEVTNSAGVISSPLYDDRGNLVGAWLFLGARDFTQSEDASSFVRATQRQVGSSLQLMRRAEINPFSRCAQEVTARLGSRPAQAAVVIICLLIATLFVPVKYKVGCNCQIQPVVRRFVAAPYDGKLEETMVEPGDEVSADELLARMDGRELRWELAGLEADYDRAEKGRDASMAVESVAKAQQASLEMERLQLKIQLVNNRLENLEIRSPLDGIVIAGDLKKTEGAPLSVGQTMFEISPLDKMIVEVEIPERDVLHVEVGQELVFRVDAYPGREWSGTIARIFPRAELRDHESVYIAEVNLDNRSGELRPGMKGRAKVIGARHALGWNLFHKPYESLCMLIGW